MRQPGVFVLSQNSRIGSRSKMIDVWMVISLSRSGPLVSGLSESNSQRDRDKETNQKRDCGRKMGGGEGGGERGRETERERLTGRQAGRQADRQRATHNPVSSVTPTYSRSTPRARL